MEMCMASYRKLSWTEADVKCPFYISDDRKRRSISCEGHTASNENVMKFITLADRDRYMGSCCVTGFTQCPVYRTVYQCKYSEDERRSV